MRGNVLLKLRLGTVVSCGLLSFACLALATSGAGQSLSKGKGDLRVMTYNVDEGTDYLEVQRATDVNQFLVAVGQTITQVRATNSPARMQAVAKQIIAAGPALVSSQELDQWFTAPFTFAGGALQHSNSIFCRSSRTLWQRRERTTPWL